MKITLTGIEVELDSREIAEIQGAIVERLTLAISAEVVDKVGTSFEWKETRRAVYGSVLDKLRHAIVKQYSAADANVGATRTDVEASPLVRHLVDNATVDDDGGAP